MDNQVTEIDHHFNIGITIIIYHENIGLELILILLFLNLTSHTNPCEGSYFKRVHLKS